jgi:hypothetical protein
MMSLHQLLCERARNSSGASWLLATLILMLAGPAGAVPIDVFVILDESGSWSAAEFADEKKFIQDFGQSLTFGISGTNSANAGFGVMSTDTRLVQDLTPSKATFAIGASGLQRGSTLGASNLLPALTLAQSRIEALGRPAADKAIVFIADGVLGDDALQLEMKINELADLGYHLFPVTVGNPPDIDADMVNYARNGGRYHALSTTSQLPGLVSTLTPELYSVPEPAVGGMVLAAGLLLAGGRVSRSRQECS